MIIVGHRGVAGRFPENTLASIQEAVTLGLDWVEVDVQPTLDNHLVVCHDHTVDRCSNGSGRVDELTLDELKTYDFGSWFNSSHNNEEILTLPELLSIAKSHNLSLNIEVKIDHHDPSKVCDLVQEVIVQSDVSLDKLIFSSFDHEVVRQLRIRLPQARLGVLSERLKSADKALLREVAAFSCNLNYKSVTQRQIAQLKKEGYQVWCYTVNNPNSLRYKHGLDAIFSDYPERFL
ncbi:glycerophosphoryl diester phosphodiesterase [Vibrio aquaticus]|uniref:Glycerophosphoryl diester phosphodiesterase n=1 Tax=Vibrio aquaticus TaxID=2496559 RepID=A0A432CZA4_9VIBR|nr:glycerophosphodiester phosphodiesterase family protein [Vibrio aquaticus]RTZ16761.1 glycerophosphoryl diester phosphodiesterase [Vibrio aquaticus]